MCGIAGIYCKDRPVPSPFVKLMTDAIRHRGPDDEGFLAVNVTTGQKWPLISSDSRVPGEPLDGFAVPANLFLGHRRLSIIDPSPAGHQPMANRDGTLWIAFNGEIYNYLELRAELAGLGYSFLTHSDTEVIIAAYETWGADCVNRFNGMWAFVIYDQRRRLLFGSRDRFGVKPFYYTTKADSFAFASEIKALLRLPFVEPRINPSAVFDYLAMGLTEHDREGFFEGIYELPPAHSFELSLHDGVLRLAKYFTLETVDRWEPYDEKKARLYLEETRQRVFDAVRLRLRSDVAIGSCLSGGVDSSTIVCVVNHLLKQGEGGQVGDRQRVFTACYEDQAIDERRWADVVVKATGARWEQTFPDAAELFGDLEDLVYHQEIPFGSTSIYAQYRVMRLAAESGVKVLLDGQGGDELFTGYAPYHTAFFADMLNNFDVSGLSRELSGMSHSSVTTRALCKSLLRYYAVGLVPRRVQQGLLRVRRENGYLNPEFWGEHHRRLDVLWDLRPTGLNDMLAKLMTGDNLKTLLRYEDRNSMRFSIEARTPFADDVELISSVFRMPAAYKIHDGWSKYLLRASMEGTVPDPIRKRTDKVGFATPEHGWLSAMKHDLEHYLSPVLGEWVDIQALQRDLNEMVARKSKVGITPIWRFLNLGIWCKVFNQNAPQ